MSRGLKIALVVLALILEFWFLAFYGNPYPHGMIGDVRYRRAERLSVARDYFRSRSPETKSAFDRELELMHRHEDWKMYLAVGLLVAANGAGVFLFLRSAKPTRTA